MTGAEFEAHIFSTVGVDLAKHPMPDLKIKYHNQHSPKEYSDICIRTVCRLISKGK